jgi:uncharacterized protein YkwD
MSFAFPRSRNARSAQPLQPSATRFGAGHRRHAIRPRRPVLARRALAAAILTSLAAAGSTLVVPAAQASTASSFASLINGARASAGERGYQYCGDLAAVAQGQAQRMASAQRLYHNPNLTTDVKNWVWVGENVGYGPTVDTLFSAFMHSPPHRANILDHDFTQVGVGAVTVNGTIWVSMVFRDPSGASSTSHPTTRSTSKGSTSASAARSGGNVTAKVVHPVPRVHPVLDLALLLPRGVTCAATPGVASMIRYLTEQPRIARLVAQSQRLIIGFQCGAGLAPTAALDVATVRALSR